MTAFKSRRISADEFIQDFIATLTPGVIPRASFIDWNQIRAKCRKYSTEIEFFENLASLSTQKLQEELQDSLLASDEPLRIMKASFELLGHTGNSYVSNTDNLDLPQFAEKIKGGDEKAANHCAAVLMEIGIRNLITVGNVEAAFLGVQVGLESHRRKNVGGRIFGEWVRELLQSTCAELGMEWEVRSEVPLPYHDRGKGKKVDFAILFREKIRIGVEVNFYTGPGSKPTEMKRAYADVNRELEKTGIKLLWITDGAGYTSMQKSLREAFGVHPNTYNYQMARRSLKSDILDYVKSPEK